MDSVTMVNSKQCHKKWRGLEFPMRQKSIAKTTEIFFLMNSVILHLFVKANEQRLAQNLKDSNLVARLVATSIISFEEELPYKIYLFLHYTEVSLSL